jgi:exodeoxyribonuclease VII large subunit
MKILSVTELTLAIKRQLEPQFSNIQVKGEVTNLRAQASGHLYFSLKDQGSQISAVLFKGSARNVSRLPKSGDQIVVRGELSLYAPRGSYQIIVREVEYAGVGELLMQLHKLKEELKGRGWLSSEHKKPLPKYPKTIGVVTSPTGSVIQDIIHVLKRRFPHFHLILHPVRVQGTGAAKEIAEAIQTFNTHQLVDVMIVGRGGGSLDVRAPTPSAAAEISVKEQAEQQAFLTQTQEQLDHILRQKVKHGTALVQGAARHPLLASPFAILSEHYQRIDDFSTQIDTSIRHLLSRNRLQLSALQRELQGRRPQEEITNLKQTLWRYSEGIQVAMTHLLKRKKEHLAQLSSHIDAVNPENVLKKGYCIPFAEKDHSVMLSARAVAPGSGMRLRFHDGTVRVRAVEVDGNKTK